MAFYTPTWLRKVIKEDSKFIVEHINKSNKNDFRSYVDARLPFTLWLEIGEIEKKVLEPNLTLLDSVIKSAFADEPEKQAWAKNTLKTVLLKAYTKVINSYIANPRYKEISQEQLQNLLEPLATLEYGNIRPYLDKTFKNTMRIGGSLSKKDRCVMLIAPSFNTIKFGQDFRNSIDLSPFGPDAEYEENKDGELVQTAYSKIRDILNDVSGKISGKKQDFYTQLQNVGHIEVDVVSAEEKKVKRGQVSPRFLQALVSVPNTPRAIEKLQTEFSKKTDQAKTRVVVRKKFKASKLVFELLVEYGIPVGIPESQVTNLEKAIKEKAFGPGSGLTKQIQTNPALLTELETSKSAKKFVEENIVQLLSTGTPAKNYFSTFSSKVSSPVSIDTLKIKKQNKSSSSSAKTLNITQPPTSRFTRKEIISIASLQELLNSSLHDQIKKNMGTGNRRDVLNYRTGRFAESVKVERISQSRQGMITAFYSYMKNPYATFSQGGRQQSPRTRDPKTLISKSIREIAQTMVTNQLRAVNV